MFGILQPNRHLYPLRIQVLLQKGPGKQMETDEDKDYREQLEKRFREMNDTDLREVLKKRKQYRQVAENLAIKEAIRRGIIQSENDLESPGFTDPGSRFSWFPSPDNPGSRNKLLRSLVRSLMIAGIIPVIMGIMKISLQKYAEGSGLAGLGLIWWALGWLLIKRRDKKIVWIMLSMALLSLLYVARLMNAYESLAWMDYLVFFAVYGVIFYSLLFILSILSIQRS